VVWAYGSYYGFIISLSFLTVQCKILYMNDTDFIISACEIKGDGFGEPLIGQAISDKIRDEALAWVHMDAQNPKTREWLGKEITYLDHIILDALLAEETRPRIVEYDQGVLMILRGVNLNEDADAEDMISIRLWVDSHRIISIQRRNLKATADIREDLKNGTGPKDSGDFIAMLSARLFERMEPTFLLLDEQLDVIEEQVMDDPQTENRGPITDVRRKAIVFRRYIAPQRDVIMHLRTSDLPWISNMHKRRLQESLDRIIRYIEDLDAIRERSQVVKDELTNALADKMNKNMYVLSVVAAIFLPLGFLTGLLGINVGGMPGADNGDAFWLVCGLCVLFSVLQIALFKILKWL
jgi:zinc transporter